jgi:gamma-glutamyltranspeptidase/glutathione hydrolase
MEDQRTAMAKYCPNPGFPGQARRSILGKGASRMRQCTLLAIVAVLAAGCSKSDSKVQVGQMDYLKGFIGGVAADEPRAALVARDVLSAGGSAADAAAAASLAYAVTYPSGGGLGAAGVCVVGDGPTKRTETIEFPIVAPKNGGNVAVPPLVRGIGLLQSRFGKLRWEAVVTPAEQLARFGEPASRAFVQAAVETIPPVTASPGLVPIFGTRTGLVPQEGERRVQFALAATLGRLRTAGPGDLYQGQLAQALLADSRAGGAGLTAEELRGYAPVIGKPIEVPFENNIVFYASNNAAGGAVAAWLIEQGHDEAGLIGSGSMKPDKFAAALGQAYRAEGPLNMYGFGSASIAVIDSNGMAVSCAFGMGPAYGSRVVGRETGILFGAVPGMAGEETAYLTAVVGLNKRVGQAFYAAGGSGGAPAPAAVAYSLLQAGFSKAKEPAVTALAAPRLFQANPQAPLQYEPGADPAALAAARSRGVNVAEFGRLGRVNLAYCSNGLPRSPDTCSFAADRRGYGLSLGRQF